METNRREFLGLAVGAAALAALPAALPLAEPVSAAARISCGWGFRINGGPWIPATEIVADSPYNGLYSAALKINSKLTGIDPWEFYARDDHQVEIALLEHGEVLWNSQPMWLHGLETHCADNEVDFTLHMSVI